MMNNVITVLSDKCNGCGVCLRRCPVSEANIVTKSGKGKMIVSVNADKCIGCGACISVCTAKARTYVDDIDTCMSKIRSEKMVILVDPSIKVLYPNRWKSILDWFRNNNCFVYDASFGYDIAAWAVMKSIAGKATPNMISPSCNAISNYIRMYKPGLIKNLSSVYSPDVCMAVFVRNYLGQRNPIVFLSPCIAKKIDHMTSGIINYDITFEHLMQYFESNNIAVPSEVYTDMDYEFENKGMPQAGFACEHPGGFALNMMDHNFDANVMSSSGIPHVYSELDSFASVSVSKLPAYYEAFSCEHGCCTGQASGVRPNIFESTVHMKHLEDDVRLALNKGKSFKSLSDDKLYKKFDEELDMADFICMHRAGSYSIVPSNDAINAVFDDMGKHTDKDRNRNCGACGYDTCREMAIAVSRGLNVKENCVAEARKAALSCETANMQLAPSLTDDVESVVQKISMIIESNDANGDKMRTVSSLLDKVIQFCTDSHVLDEDAVHQMIQILEIIIDAFDVFDDNTTIMQQTVSDIRDLIQKLSSTPLLTN